MRINWTAVAFAVTTLVGPGAVWMYQQNKIDGLKYNLEKSARSVELRNQMAVLMEKIIVKTGEFVPLDLCNQDRFKNRAQELHSQLNLLKDDFKSIEKDLAGIENRQPRDINLQFSAPCPPSVRMQ
jgi:hypothetical protein